MSSFVRVLGGLVVGVLLLNGCGEGDSAPSSQDLAKDKAAIKETSDAWANASRDWLQTFDGPKFMSFFLPDALVILPDIPQALDFDTLSGLYQSEVDRQWLLREGME